MAQLQWSPRVSLPITSMVLIGAFALSGCVLVVDDGDDGGSSFSGFGDGGTGGGEDGPETTGDGDGGSTGDGDGDPGTTGDGDGDPGTTGDGDGDPGTTGDGDGDPGTTGDGDGDPDVPPVAYCDPTLNWDPAWTERELQVLTLVNQARAVGGNCGAEGSFGPSAPLTIHPALMCAARIHSKDMADNNYFSHTNQQGNGPGWRMSQAGYGGGGWGENIGAGYGTPQDAVNGWLGSDGHCANMLNSGFSKIGIGYAYGQASQYGNYWTQKFGN